MTIELTVLPTVSYRGHEITAPRLRGLIALLAGDERSGCGTGRLIEGLWPDERPANPAKALQVLVARARSLLGPEVIVSTPTGYRLALGPDRIDASALLLHAAAAAEKSRAGDHAGALAEAEAGLELWDGAGAAPPDGTAPDAAAGDPVAELRAGCAAAHRGLRRAGALALARTGGRDAAVAPLTRALADHPRDEELLLELMRCEASVSGAAVALMLYDRHRRALRDELGTDPGPALRAFHQELLRGERPAIRRGVPHEPNQLLGREADIAAVERLLGVSRVTSIVGPGGLGKTRLAGAVGRRSGARSVHMVALAAVTDDADVADAVAEAVGARDPSRSPQHPPGSPAGGRRTADLVGAIVPAVGSGPALLILDNCEQVVAGVADLVGALVAATRELRILTTGRAPLGLSSESVHLLPELDPRAAVELFGRRARAARPGVELPRDEVAEVCRRLDGLPLAIELAAARVRVMTVAEMGRRLEDRFALLRGGARDTPERHRTLHAVVDWSWNLLEPRARAALRVMSVFPGGFTAEAARAVLGNHPRFTGPGGDDVLSVLEDLVDQSLLRVTDTPSGARFGMLETVREFGAAHRGRAGEDAAVATWFTAWAADFGRSHHEGLFGPDTAAVRQRARAEQDNLVRALALALAARDGDAVAAVAAVLAGLWTVESHYARIGTLVETTARLFSHHRPGAASVEATRTVATLVCVGSLLGTGRAEPRFLLALRRLPAAPPDTLVRAAATVLCALPGVLGPDGAVLRELRAGDQPLLAGVADGFAGFAAESGQDPERAIAAVSGMLAAVEGLGLPWLEVVALSRLAELYLHHERGAEARESIGRAIAILDGSGAWTDTMGLRWAMVLATLQTGAVDEAGHWLEAAVREEPGDSIELLAPDLAARAETALARGDTDRGLALWRQAVERLAGGTVPAAYGAELDLEPWSLEVRAVTVAAHARHGALHAVGELLADLPGRLAARLESRRGPAHRRPPAGTAVSGALALALGLADLASPALPVGPADTVAAARRRERGIRLVVLADRLGCPRTFHPTMSSAASERLARAADGAVYAAAVAEYAGLDRDGLAAAGLALLAGEEQDGAR
ncbi:ATP-binding protein [Streptomyces yaizuensis]|uniref:AfsR/SARP family transcriptional regulator n=1 Tax=Streptomyces yaizuensis TaxID=2989713 RepID=A0ABQ5NX84_9ACTN|nr:BTAD domain-containing putative transcriptional regulator [Streptomyces sp. YSPA8]GLF94966.1 AfsR/SARP family transcriptional regulator [Streptomyces sp. YSPA8]